MNIKLPEYLLCEDPTADKEDLFIYHTPSRSLVHILHSSSIPDSNTDIRYLNRRHFNYIYRNNQGKTERIIFVAEIVDPSHNQEQSILETCAHWYACYLGWENDCEDFKPKRMV